MGKKLKPGQRCTNSPGVCGNNGVTHYYHKPFDNPRASRTAGGRCAYVQPAPPAVTPREAAHRYLAGVSGGCICPGKETGEVHGMVCEMVAAAIKWDRELRA